MHEQDMTQQKHRERKNEYPKGGAVSASRGNRGRNIIILVCGVRKHTRQKECAVTESREFF